MTVIQNDKETPYKDDSNKQEESGNDDDKLATRDMAPEQLSVDDNVDMVNDDENQNQKTGSDMFNGGIEHMEGQEVKDEDDDKDKDVIEKME